MTYRQDVAEVQRLTRMIDRAEKDSDAWKWDRAARLAQMCETNGQREVARDVGMKHPTLRAILATWEAAGGQVPAQRSYTEVYYEATGQKPNHGGGRTPKEKAANVLKALADPEVGREVAKTAPKAQEQLVREIAKTNPGAVGKVYAETTPVATPAERKAAEAAASTITQGMKDAAAGLHANAVVEIAEVLTELADDLAEIKAKVSARDLTKLRRAYDRVGQEIQVLEFNTQLEGVG